MNQLKSFVQKGDQQKTAILAKHVALLRNASNRNLNRSLFLEMDMAIMQSNARLARAQMEHLKGMRYINCQDTPETAFQRDAKYQRLVHDNEIIENLLSEGFDDIYENMDEMQATPEYFDAQLSAIVREAIDPKLNRRDYDPDANASTPVTLFYIDFEKCSIGGQID